PAARGAARSRRGRLPLPLPWERHVAGEARRPPGERRARPRQPARLARRPGAQARALRRGPRGQTRSAVGARPDRGRGRRMRVRRLDHFGVDVADLARAERFYTEVLGMTVRMRLPDQLLLSYGDGGCALFFKPDREPGGLDRSRTRSASRTTPSRSATRTSSPPRRSSPRAGSPTTHRSTGATTTVSTSSTPTATSSRSWAIASGGRDARGG